MNLKDPLGNVGYSEDLVLHKRINIKTDLGMGICGIDLPGSGSRPVADSCEQRNAHLGSIVRWELLE
jgi:hypothetical protein